ncbi:MAG: hypothetical protein QXI60_08765 [Thermofilaceae archaeon]
MAKSKRSGGRWIQQAIKRPGALTEKARRRGMSPLQFARQVVSNPDAYDTRTVRQANLALTLSRLSKRRKKGGRKRRKKRS